MVNLPGSQDYDPSLTWVFKVKENGELASDVHQYVDDGRITAESEWEAWNCSCFVGKMCLYFGLQDAARKRREPSQNPGAWAGAVISTENGLSKCVSQERWIKTRESINWFTQFCSVNPVPNCTLQKEQSNCPAGCIPHKKALSLRGFLVYVSRTYKSLVPYLKGLHLTIDSWRKNRDEDG